MKTTIEDAIKRGTCYCSLCGLPRTLNAECENKCEPYLGVMDTPREEPLPEPDMRGFFALEQAYKESELAEEILRLADHPVAARRQYDLRESIEPLLEECREYFELVRFEKAHT